jgi:hypothetical protein
MLINIFDAGYRSPTFGRFLSDLPNPSGFILILLYYPPHYIHLKKTGFP